MRSGQEKKLAFGVSNNASDLRKSFPESGYSGVSLVSEVTFQVVRAVGRIEYSRSPPVQLPGARA